MRAAAGRAIKATSMTIWRTGRRVLERLWSFSESNVKMRTVVGAGLILIVGGWFYNVRLSEVEAQARHEASQQVVEATFQAEYLAWQTTALLYQQCVSAVDRSDGLREWIGRLAAIVERETGAVAVAAEIRSDRDELFAARKLSDCTEPGPPPLRPAGAELPPSIESIVPETTG